MGKPVWNEFKRVGGEELERLVEREWEMGR